jgi:hypothetical protein
MPGTPSLGCMIFGWDNSRAAFADAAGWFVRTAALVGDRWDRPGLGVWDVRSLVGHTSRALVTVETYLARPAAAVDIPSAAAGQGALHRFRHCGLHYEYGESPGKKPGILDSAAVAI